MLQRFGEWVTWQRTQQYLNRYHPTMIGVTGTVQAHLALSAISLVVHDHYRLRASDEYIMSSHQVAEAVLGVSRAAHPRSWWRILIGSRAQEIIEEEPEIIAVEIPAVVPGQVDQVGNAIAFKIGVVTDVTSINLGLFGSKEMVAHEQLSLLSNLPANSCAILNADDRVIAAMSAHTKARLLTFGYDSAATIHFRRVEHLATRGIAMEVVIDSRAYEIALPYIVGQHQVVAVGAALAVAHVLKIPITSALNDLRKLKPAPGHMVSMEGIHQSLVIDDSFDATYEDTIMAIDTLGQLPAPGRRIAILGEIRDAGSMSHRAYQEIGQKVADTAHLFVAVGKEMLLAQTVVLKQGGVDTHHFQDSRDVGKWLPDYIRPGDVILVKGSRSMRMEEVVNRLRK